MSTILKKEEFKTGEELGEDRLGGGNFGSVFRCYWFKPGSDVRRVAIKFVSVSGDKGKGGEARGQGSRLDRTAAMREIELLEKVEKMKFALHAYGYVESPGWLGLVLQYAERGNLYDVRRKVNLPWKLRVRMLQEAASGMAQLHSLGDDFRMTHNDLKPQNILIDRDFHVKIGDLGGSNVDKYSTFASFVPNNGTYRVRTAFYAAPEFLLRTGPLTRRRSMDVYSYAMVIYFVLTGNEPFEACENEAAVKTKLSKGIYPEMDVAKHKKRLTGEDLEDFDALHSVMVKAWIYDGKAQASPRHGIASNEGKDSGIGSMPSSTSQDGDPNNTDSEVAADASDNAADRRPSMQAILDELSAYLKGKEKAVESAVKEAEEYSPFHEKPLPRKYVTFEERCQQLEDERKTESA